MSGSLSSAWRSAGSNFNFRGGFEHNRLTSPQDSSAHSSSRRSIRLSGILSFPKPSIAISCCLSDREKISLTHSCTLTNLFCGNDLCAGRGQGYRRGYGYPDNKDLGYSSNYSNSTQRFLMKTVSRCLSTSLCLSCTLVDTG